MKLLLFVAGIFLTANTFAQTNTIKLNKGQIITVTSTISQNMDMGMGMSMTSGSNSTHVIKVNEESGNNYSITTTLTKMKSNTSAMGQDTKYDSEDAAGSDSELATIFEKSLNSPENSLLDKTTGIAKSASTKEDEADGEGEDDFLKGLMGGATGNDNSGIVSSAFFTPMVGKKVGEKWMDSSTVSGFHNMTNYTIESINGDMMTIFMEGTISGTQQIETQGMQIDVTMNTKNKGTIVMNKKSLQVVKRTVDAEVSSTMDMMGQSMDMTGTIKTVTEYK